MNFIVEGYPAYAYTGGRPHDPKLPGVVFVHGAALDHSAWQWQSRHLAHHGFGVLAVDLPGHGRSPGALRGSIEALADWVAAFIEAAGLESAALVGHSMGSLVALDAAIRHPARVRRLALVGTSAPMPVGEAFLAAARDDSPAAFDMQSVWGHARLGALATSAVPGTSLVAAGRALAARSRPGVQHADLAACRAYAPSLDAVRTVAVPTLVVAGRRDQMTPFRAGEALAKEIPGARFLLLDAGHDLPSEAPRELARSLRSWLA